jgi:hypothetical protein
MIRTQSPGELIVQHKDEEAAMTGVRRHLSYTTVGRLSTLAALSAAILLPAPARATTFRLGPEFAFDTPVPNLKCESPCTGGKTLHSSYRPEWSGKRPPPG